jgi:hypothetical protein
MDHGHLDCLKWDASGRRWCGLVEVTPGRLVEVAVLAGRRDPAVPLALARLALSLIRPGLDEARHFAARQLLEYYNVFNAHLRDGEQLGEAEFASRLELEAIGFTEKGSSTLDFRHSLYRGYRNYEGGLIVVMTRFDGEFRKASWVTAADTEEWRRTRRCRCNVGCQAPSS